MSELQHPSFDVAQSVIDELKIAQRLADIMGADADKKLQHLQASVGRSMVGELIGRALLVSSSLALGKRPDGPPGNRLLFEHGLMFIGRLESPSYLRDRQLPLDALTLIFSGPEVIGPYPEEIERLRRLQLQVPVLAIDSCTSAEAA